MKKDLGNRYVPGEPPQTESVQDVREWALRELQAASNIINNIAAGQVDVCFKPPDKPRTGMIRYADGTGWNPGATGRGFYGYIEGIGWRFLG